MSLSLYRGAFCVAGAALLWGTAGTAQTFLDGSLLSPLWVGALRLVFAVLFFLPLLISREGSSALKPVEGVCAKYVLACGLAMGAYNLLFFAAMRLSGVAVGTAIVIGSAPVWACLLEGIWQKEKPTPMRLLGLAVAIFGGGLMATAGRADLALDPTGILVCLAAGFAYASYTVVTKRLVGNVTPLRATTQSFSIAVLVALCAALFFAPWPTLTFSGVSVTLYLGLFTTGVAYLLFSTGLKSLRASTGVALSLLEPVTAFLLAVTVAGEAVTGTAVVAMGLLLVGLFIVLRAEG